MKSTVGKGDLLFEDDPDYAKREYGVTDAELDAFVERMDKELERDRAMGRITRYSGDLEADLGI